mmetsp:Transcript_50150/g.99708  ORF Transcript_50150/g.99708 Transcript_50150/m.99708 type:complete len:216 (-) Transcript_50150:1765-2412(-)
MTPSPSASKRLNNSSSERSLSCWLYRTTLSAESRTLSTSKVRFLPTSSSNRDSKFTERLIRPSMRPSLESCFLVSLDMKLASSLLKSSSRPSLRPVIFSCAVFTASRARLQTPLISSAKAFICATRKPLLLVARGFTSSSAFETDWSASVMLSAAVLILSISLALASLKRCFLNAASLRRLASRSSSRATPTAHLARPNLLRGMPVSLNFCEYSA